MTNNRYSKHNLQSLSRRIFFVALTIVFVSEFTMMTVLSWLNIQNWLLEFAIDAISVTLTVALVIWFVVIKPLQKTAMHEIIRSENLMTSSFEGILTFDISGKIESFNEAAGKMFGYQPSEAIRRLVTDLLPSLNLEQAAALAPSQKRPNNAPPLEFLCNKKDGTTFLAEIALNRLRLVERSFYVLYVRDISARKEAEKTIADQQAMLAAAARLSVLGELAGGIAHEINNPLGAIKLNTDMLTDLLKAEQLDRNAAAQMLEMISDTTIRIAKIVAGLRMLSRHDKNATFEPIKVTKIIENTLALYNDLCPERFKKQGIELIIDHDTNTNVLCRSIQMSQVLINLLNNAYDAIKNNNDRWIRISTVDFPDKVEIAITDSGLGIPEEVQRQLFRPLFTTKPAGTGTGLGLSISQKIIIDHGGSLTLDANSKNTRFVIRLPK